MTEHASRRYGGRHALLAAGAALLCLRDRGVGAGRGAELHGLVGAGEPRAVDQHGGRATPGPALSADGLSLYFDSNRPGGFGGNDLWVSQRADGRATPGEHR